MLTLALFTHGKQVQIARLIAVQAHAIYRVVAFGQVRRCLPLAGFRVQAEQRDLLPGLVLAGHQYVVAQRAAVEPGERTGNLAQGFALRIEQQHAVALAHGQAIIACGQVTQRLGFARAPGLQGWRGDLRRLCAACCQAYQQR